MSQAKAFRAESRFIPETGARVQCVGIQCRKCETEEWHPAPHAGWGRRIFKKKGWSVGNSMSSHTCPACITKRRAGSGHKAAEVEIAASPVAYVPPSPESQSPQEPVNTVLAEALAPVMAKMEAATKLNQRRKDNPASGHPTDKAAAAHAWRLLTKMGVAIPRRNINYRVEPEDGGTFGYVVINTDSQMPSPNWKPRGPARAPKIKLRSSAKRPGQLLRGTAANVRKSATNYLMALGVRDPQLGIHYRIVGSEGNRQRDTMFYEILSTAQSKEWPVDDLHPFRTEQGARTAARMEVSRRNPLATPQRDQDYFIQEKAGWFGYTLSPPDPLAQAGPPQGSETPDQGRRLPRLTRHNGPGYPFSALGAARNGADNYLKGRGVPSPVEGVHFRLIRGEQYGDPAKSRYRFRFELIDQAQAAQDAASQFGRDIEAIIETIQETPPVSDASTQAVRDLEDRPHAPPPPLATRDDNKRIRDMLDASYDEPNQRYKALGTDAKLAEQMNMPRKWIADVREAFYGPEGNEAQEIERRRIMEKLSLAQAKIEAALETVNKVVELAAELERQRADIKVLIEAAK